MQVQPYLMFNGRCEEAIEFYKRVLGAKVEALMRYKEAPQPPPSEQLPPGNENKVMHSSLRIGDTVVMASDGHCSGQTDFQGFSLTVSVPDAPTADRIFGELSEGGKVQMPMGKTFFSDRFGMTADRFGLGWMVIVQ